MVEGRWLGQVPPCCNQIVMGGRSRRTTEPSQSDAQYFPYWGVRPSMAKAIPLHWGKDGKDPKPPCEFALLVSWAFEGIPPNTHLGSCDSTIPTVAYVERPTDIQNPSEQPSVPLQFKLCSTHRGRAVETDAEKEGDYRVIK